MGVDVDEARRDDPAGRVDRLACILGDLADGDDAPVLDADVALKARCAAAIDDRAAGDLQIQHVAFLFAWARRSPSNPAMKT